MFKQFFTTDALKSALECNLGFGLTTLDRVRGGGALNFKAVRASDGLPFLVKCYQAERFGDYETLSSNLQAVSGPKTPTRLFEDAGEMSFAGCALLFLKWLPGTFVSLDQLSDEQWLAFLRDYESLSVSMQAARQNGEAYPLGVWRDCALSACRGWFGRFLRSSLVAMRDENLEFVPSRLRTIHGDFHCGNVLFENGRVKCFMDLESLRAGYPAEDIVCYCMNAYGQVSGSRAGRVLSLFAQAVRILPYDPQEWLTAINAFSLLRFRAKSRGFANMGLKRSLEMFIQFRTDDMFRRVVAVQKCN